jgi:DNA primase
MFPILSSREKVIAFGGRAMSPDAQAKYLNSNETELFHKGNVLYNFARARRAVQVSGRTDSGGQESDSAGTIIAVEGYMDVIALHQAGVGNAVAPLGTAMTEAQLELLWRMSPQPVLCFDGDVAGIRAANRAVDLALPHLKPGRSVRFALLPDGKDPDELVRHEGRAPFDRVMARARPLAEMVWNREVGSGRFDTPEARAELEARLKNVIAVIADESVRRHYQQDMRDRLSAFFQPQFQDRSASQRGFDRRDGRRGFGARGDHASGGRAPSTKASERLVRSGMIKGHQEVPALRESVLALTIVNQPQLLRDEYDEIAAIDYESRDLQRLWSAMLGAVAGMAGPLLSRETLVETLEKQGFDALLKALGQQVRNARLWTATEEAAIEDAREGYLQALALHKRSKALRWQRFELEREIAEATEAVDGDAIDQLMRALQEVQLEGLRLENQEAIIDGFGVLSGRVKGPAAR